MKPINLALVVPLLALAALPALADEDASGALLQLHFAKGSSSASFDDAVDKGRTEAYEFSARAGQTVTIDILALQKNAAFSLYAPGATATRKDATSSPDVAGTTLPGAENHPSEMPWTGVLPTTGRYILAFTSTDGDDATIGGSITIK